MLTLLSGAREKREHASVFIGARGCMHAGRRGRAACPGAGRRQQRPGGAGGWLGGLWAMPLAWWVRCAAMGRQRWRAERAASMPKGRAAWWSTQKRERGAGRPVQGAGRRWRGGSATWPCARAEGTKGGRPALGGVGRLQRFFFRKIELTKCKLKQKNLDEIKTCSGENQR